MPWKITEPMDQKIQLIAEWQQEQYSITDLSKKYGVSRKTVYKWCLRYEKQGIDGLKDQDRTPKHSPNKTAEDILKLIVNEKLKNRKRGPKKIYYQLKQQYPGIEFPVPSTISHWLKENGLVNKRKLRKRVPPYTEPFIKAQAPNNVWSADYKGQFYTKDKRLCYPLTISDNYSRYLLKCKGLPGPRYSLTRDVFEEVFREYGLPDAIRTDNGTPFAGKCIGGLSRLSIWWIQLGIMPERIEKGCPEQNGRHERMHRTLKLETIDATVTSMKEQQERFNGFGYDYNNYRPHEALNNEPPANYYKKSSRPYVEKIPSIEYDLGYTVRRLHHRGYCKFKGQEYYVTRALDKECIALKEFADGQWKIFYSFYPLGILDLRKNRVLRLT
jgi:transposase InsO family protein